MSNSIYLHCSACSIQTSSPLNLGKNDQLSHDCHNYTNSSVDSDLEIISLSVTCTSFHNNNYIREYGSTLYVGMAGEKNGRPYISIVNGKLESLVIYTNKLKCT